MIARVSRISMKKHSKSSLLTMLGLTVGAALGRVARLCGTGDQSGRLEAGAPLPPPAMQTGVAINAITRNDSASEVNLALARDGRALLPIVISRRGLLQAVKASRRRVETVSRSDRGRRTSRLRPAMAKVGHRGGFSLSDFPIPALEQGAGNQKRHRRQRCLRDSHARGQTVAAWARPTWGPATPSTRLLEELGCRWFFPDTTGDWTVVPSIQELKFRARHHRSSGVFGAPHLVCLGHLCRCRSSVGRGA